MLSYTLVLLHSMFTFLGLAPNSSLEMLSEYKEDETPEPVQTVHSAI